MHINCNSKGDSIARLTLTAKKLDLTDKLDPLNRRVTIRLGGRRRTAPGKFYSYKGRR